MSGCIIESLSSWFAFPLVHLFVINDVKYLCLIHLNHLQLFYCNDLLSYNASGTVSSSSRVFCRPVGGYSIYTSHGSLDNVKNDLNKPLIWLSAAMDSQSIFPLLSSGANAYLSSAISLLAVADMLSHVCQVFSLPTVYLWSKTKNFCFFCRDCLIFN